MKTVAKLAVRLLAISFMASSDALFCVACEQGDDRTPTERIFVISLIGDLKTEFPGGMENVHADTRMRISLDRRLNELLLTFHAIEVKVLSNKKPIMNLSLDRRSWKDRISNVEAARSNAPDGILQQLDAFERPICTLKTNKDGTENQPILSDGVRPDSLPARQIVNALFFQPPFNAQELEWRVMRQVTVSPSATVTGELTYKKNVKAAKDGYVSVDVRGELTNRSYRLEKSPVTAKDTKYVVQGEQTYNSRTRIWERGRITFDVSSMLTVPGQPDGSVQGKMTYSFEPASANQ